MTARHLLARIELKGRKVIGFSDIPDFFARKFSPHYSSLLLFLLLFLEILPLLLSIEIFLKISLSHFLGTNSYRSLMKYFEFLSIQSYDL